MGTLLTNPKMGPALRARIERSVRGSRPSGKRAARPSAVATLRIALVAGVVGIACVLVAAKRRSAFELSAARTELREMVQAAHARVTERGRRFVSTTEALLLRETGAYAGDVRSEDLTGPEAFDELLAREAVFLRAPLAAVKTKAGLSQVARDTGKETFLQCLVDPPPSREERDLVLRVNGVYQGQSSAREKSASVHRLDDAFVSAQFLSPLWLEQIERTDSRRELASLEASFRRANLTEKQAALEAENLIYVFDEEQEAGTASEFDGASRHMVRIGIVEVTSGRVRLRERRQSDPSWISERRRLTHARGFEGCRMAFDLRRDLSTTVVAR